MAQLQTPLGVAPRGGCTGKGLVHRHGDWIAQMAKRRRRKIKPFQMYGMAVGLLGFFIPAVCLIPYWILVKNFIASDRLLGTSLIASSAMAILLSVAVWPQFVNEFRRTRAAGRMKSIFVMAFTPGFVFIIFHAFVTQFSAFALHTLHETGQVQVVRNVVGAEYGGKSCRRPAILEGDTFLLPQRVCGLATGDNRALERGGSIELTGTSSAFGFRVRQYRIATEQPLRSHASASGR